MPDTLIIGFGNPGRLDDGLGPALADAVEKMGIEGVTVDSDYQLSVEDALPVSQHNTVIFADADENGPEPFYMKKIEPENYISFSSHSISPRALTGLAGQLFGKSAEAYILGIRGYRFNEFGEGLSEKAKQNLEDALEFIEASLKNRNFEEIRADQVPVPEIKETIDN